MHRPCVQARVNQADVLWSKIQRSVSHFLLVRGAPGRFHDTIAGVPVSSLQDVGDFMGQDVGQKRRHVIGTGSISLAIDKNMDMDSFEGKRIGKRTGKTLSGCPFSRLI
jgi:hypothetical protein